MASTDRPRRGRPRPAEAIERDERIKTLLTEEGPQTRNRIAEVLGTTYSLTYLALDRLRQQGAVKRCLLSDGSSVWSTDTESPCP
jgi:predicted ArsR family transcriptional regulator